MIVNEPVRGEAAVQRLLALSGREQMDLFISGAVAPPPIHHLLGMRPTAAAAGTATFVMPTSGWLAGHSGFVPGGLLAVLADGPLGSALQTTLAPGVHYTTAELTMSYLRPALPESGEIVATGRLIHAGRSLGLTECALVDAAGREIAHSTSRCFIFPPRSDLPPYEPAPPWTQPEWDTPDPWQRPVEGTVVPASELAARGGLATWLALASGELPAPPVSVLTGLTPVSGSEGEVTVRMPATAWHTSPVGTVEGGFIAYLADAAVWGAASTLAPPGTMAAALDVTVKFLRPVFPDGRDLLARGRVLHGGRNVVVAAADLVNADGKLVATALGSAMLLRHEPSASPPAVEDAPTPG